MTTGSFLIPLLFVVCCLVSLVQICSCDDEKQENPEDATTAKPKEDISKAALECHNKHRKHAGLAKLEIDRDLVDEAELYVKKLADKFSCTTATRSKGSDKKDRGENVFHSDDGSALGSDIMRGGCQQWYSEIIEYEFPGQNEGYLNCSKTHYKDVSQFTQMMWNLTRHIGCALFKCVNEQSVVACFYKPKGNNKTEPIFSDKAFKKLCKKEPDRLVSCNKKLYRVEGCENFVVPQRPPIMSIIFHLLIVITTISC